MTTTTAATASITSTLGVGSGIDTKALVDQLVDAQFANKNTALTKKNDTLTAQISAVSQLSSGITGFASALAALTKTGQLATQPTSSNNGILTVSRLAGANLSGFSAQVEVRQLASAQAAATGPIADRTASIGTGTLTLTLGTATTANNAITGFTPGSTAPVTLTIDSAHSSLDEIAKAINAANTGVTATIVSDADGARLTLKGKSGADQAFTLTANEDPGAPGLAALNVGPGATGTTIGTVAKDAIVAIDGVALKRSTNSINDLIPGIQLDLASAVPGSIVTLGAVRPTAELSEAVTNFVDTFNQLQAVVKGATDGATGALHNDSAAKALSRSLGQLTAVTLVSDAPAGAPTTLAGIGIETNRDGTLSVDATKLSKALADWPDAVEAIFSDGTGAASGGLSAALTAIATSATDKTYGLGASTTTYSKAQDDIADQETAATDAATKLRDQLTQQFAAMDARVAAYKSTQDFLKQQIDAWNSQDN